MHEYKSGIGYFDSKKMRIIGEQEFSESKDFKQFCDTEYRLYDCKIILILNNIYVNGKPHEGKCLYIPIDKDDKRTVFDSDFRHDEYIYHTLNNYIWGDKGQNHPIQEMLKKRDKFDFAEIAAVLAKSGIAVFSNVQYMRKEPIRKEAMLYQPNIYIRSQIAQFREMQYMLERERYVIGLNSLEDDNDEYEFYFDGNLYTENGDNLAERIIQRQNEFEKEFGE